MLSAAAKRLLTLCFSKLLVFLFYKSPEISVALGSEATGREIPLCSFLFTENRTQFF